MLVCMPRFSEIIPLAAPGHATESKTGRSPLLCSLPFACKIDKVNWQGLIYQRHEAITKAASSYIARKEMMLECLRDMTFLWSFQESTELTVMPSRALPALPAIMIKNSLEVGLVRD